MFANENDLCGNLVIPLRNPTEHASDELHYTAIVDKIITKVFDKYRAVQADVFKAFNRKPLDESDKVYIQDERISAPKDLITIKTESLEEFKKNYAKLGKKPEDTADVGDATAAAEPHTPDANLVHAAVTELCNDVRFKVAFFMGSEELYLKKVLLTNNKLTEPFFDYSAIILLSFYPTHEPKILERSLEYIITVIEYAMQDINVAKHPAHASPPHDHDKIEKKLKEIDNAKGKAMASIDTVLGGLKAAVAKTEDKHKIQQDSTTINDAIKPFYQAIIVFHYDYTHNLL